VETTSGFANLAAEVIARCRKLASLSEDAGGTRRTFLSAPMRDCHREIAGWLEALGARVHVDAVGNLRGFYPGVSPGVPRILVGSHLDTVPNAGAFDGILGVVLAVGLVKSLEGMKLPFGDRGRWFFPEEEGVRFGVPFIGSRALVGRVDEELLGRKDEQGVSVRKAIQDFGLNPNEISKAAPGDDVLGYIEFHIEQGPVLEHLGRPLGVVEAIVGQKPFGVHVFRASESRGHDAHESEARRAGRGCGVDSCRREPGTEHRGNRGDRGIRLKQGPARRT